MSKDHIVTLTIQCKKSEAEDIMRDTQARNELGRRVLFALSGRHDMDNIYSTGDIQFMSRKEERAAPERDPVHKPDC